MDLGLVGRKALITGATKGIGRVIAETLLAEGAHVAICSRTEDDVFNAVAELKELGTVVGQVADAGDAASLQAWVSDSIESLGGADIYVHNTSALSAKTLDGWADNFSVDLMALPRALETAEEALAGGDGGSVITIGSIAAQEHFGRGSNSYSAFKAAVTSWTLGQAQVLGAKGIRCNVVSPGPILVEGGFWDRTRKDYPDYFDETEQQHPVGRMGGPEDVADLVAFLACDRARHINGANITVDGGFVKRINY